MYLQKGDKRNIKETKRYEWDMKRLPFF